MVGVRDQITKWLVLLAFLFKKEKKKQHVCSKHGDQFKFMVYIDNLGRSRSNLGF